MDWKEIISQILAYLLKTGFKRFLTGLILIGVGLLGVSWIDVAIHISNKIPSEERSSTGISLAEIVGITLIVIGVVGRFTVHLISIYSTERKKAAQLMGRLRVLVEGFTDKSIKKDSGYFNNEVIQCKEAAEEFMEVAPKFFSGNIVVASVVNPKFDASKNEPYIDITLIQIENLITELGKRYGIK
jgi:hypothetical protein